MNEPTEKSFFLVPVTENEVLKVVCAESVDSLLHVT